ncbi:MAG: cytidine deaminase [Epulopiscium sp.]|nr:cytidine deaminase [Candidatus Epulonipiscium sp.]
MKVEELLSYATYAKQYAYAPYSNFQVGAAVLTSSGKVYTGCNIENASYGATNCAERTAFFKAISEGERDFKAIAIVSSSQDETFPCGICRQVMMEFMPDGIVILETKEKQIKQYRVQELLPYAFTKKDF